jgi:hypothetical protein
LLTSSGWGKGFRIEERRDQVPLKTAAPAVDNRYQEGTMHAIVWFLLGMFFGGLAGVMIAALGAAGARTARIR